jgi:hypothetical protein
MSFRQETCEFMSFPHEGLAASLTAFTDHMKETAILGTMLPLSMITNFFHKRFEKLSMLEPTLEIMLHFYIQMMTEPSGYSILPGDLAYSRCGQIISPRGSTGKNSNACTPLNVTSLGHDST